MIYARSRASPSSNQAKARGHLDSRLVEADPDG
jgi:hypothetical protein